MERADYGRVVVLGFAWVVVPFLLFPIAQQHIDSALAGMLNASVPILSAAVAVVLLRSLRRFTVGRGVPPLSSRSVLAGCDRFAALPSVAALIH